VAPASAARGLDFKDVSHVFTLGLLVADATEYAHLAGRTGRVGQATTGLVTSILFDAEQVVALRAVVEGELGRKLLVSATSDPALAGEGESEDDLIRRLDDSLLLEVDDEQNDS